jgi:hypothetical protein
MGLFTPKSAKDPRYDPRNPNRAFEQLKYAAAAARLQTDKDVWLNLAFYLDQQYVEWSEATRTIRAIPR